MFFGLNNHVWKFLEIDAEHVCLFDFFWGIERKVWFEKSGLNSCVFGKHLISYSCIFLIKFNALRGGCTKIGCFSKNSFFQNFDRSKIIFDRSKMFQFQFKSFWLTRSIYTVFGSIEAIFDRSNVIFDQSKIVLVLFKKEISMKSSLLFSNFFKLFVSYPPVNEIFAVFGVFLQIFCTISLSQGR